MASAVHDTPGVSLWLNGAKPSRAVSADGLRPTLQHAHVYERNGRREIAATDSYMMVSLPVDEETPIGPVSIEALKRIEARETHVITPDSVEVTPKGTGTKVIYLAPDVGVPPDFSALLAKAPEPAETVVRVGLNPKLLVRLAAALGARQGVVLEIRVKDATTLKQIRVRREGAGDGDGEGLLMPMRVNP